MVGQPLRGSGGQPYETLHMTSEYPHVHVQQVNAFTWGTHACGPTAQPDRWQINCGILGA